MADTIREQIIQAIITAIGSVRTSNGYNTECGQNVERAANNLEPSDLPVLVVWPGSEQSERDYGVHNNSMSCRIEGLKNYGSSNHSVISEQMLGDIIEAMTATVFTLPYTSGSDAIEVGDTITGATSAATGYVCGVSLTSGTWAGGDAAGDLTSGHR